MQTPKSAHGMRIAVWTALALLAACRPADEEMSWARAALERNEQLEIVAQDDEMQTFTVKNKATGELRVLRVDEIAGGPIATAQSAPAAETPAEPPLTRGTPEAGEPAPAPDAAEPAEPAAEAEPREPAATPSVASTGGRVIASGPGYSIQAAAQAAPTRTAQEAASTQGLERRSEPLICQGSRFLRIDGRNIAFDGDAVRAEDGCELYITNSRLVANGVGLAVRGANVHITNSTVTGQQGAIHASGNSNIYAHSSRFRGMVRRLDDAVLHDMGQNVWN